MRRAEVCDNDAARNIGTAWSRALSQQSTGGDVTQLLASMRTAVDSAPEAIRDDFRVLLAAQTPLFDVIARAGNIAQVGQDPAFRDAITRLGSPEVVQATGRVNAWFVKNCPVRS